MTARPGTVYLVGAGPGDPRLITVRGRELLERADVVLYDRLVSAALLDHVASGAMQICVGKSPRGPAVSQEEINNLLVLHARAGQLVVRLKGGDPLVFGRGWEEREACERANVPCEIIPGISSALAGPAAAGIPVTRRGVASSVAIVDGHEITERQLQLASRADTSVFLMAVNELRSLAEKLVDAGVDASTPAAIVERATLPGQRTVCSTLAGIADAAVAEDIQSPAVVVVGKTAAFAKLPKLGPLAGRRIVVTRPENASNELTNALRALGADVTLAPLIGIELRSPVGVELLDRLPSFDWIVFSSRNGVRGFRLVLEQLNRDVRVLGHAQVAAVGPITAHELQAWGIRANLIANPARAEALVKQLLAHTPRPRRVLLPGGTLALDTISDALTLNDINVERLSVYETKRLKLDERARRTIERGVDAVLFASPSAVTAFAESDADIGEALAVCIGPTTATRAVALNWKNVVVAEEHTDAGTVAATCSALGTLEALSA